jgi:phenazine biosynthesis protein phzE
VVHVATTHSTVQDVEMTAIIHHGEHDEFGAHGVGPVRVSRDPANGEVHALRGLGFASLQFHPESVLTRGGPRILATGLAGLLAPAGTPAAA